MRMTKVALDTMDFMNKLSEKAQNEKEFIDILGVWSQTLGARLASLDGSTVTGMDKFMPFIKAHIEVAYTSRWEYDHGEK